MSSEPLLYTTRAMSTPAFLCSLTMEPMHVESIVVFIFVMFFSTLGSLSDDSLTKLPYYTGDGENSDYKSAPGNRGESALAG